MAQEVKRSRVCAVCGFVSDNFYLNYGAPVCFSCRAFFRRVVRKGLTESSLKCVADPRGEADLSEFSCVISVEDRRCRKCRFRKCLKVGMQVEMVLDENQRGHRFRKTLRKQRRPEPSGSQNRRRNRVSEADESNLMEASNTSGMELSNPMTNTQTPQAIGVRSESSTMRPESSIMRPESHVARPESYVARPESYVARPESYVVRPEPHVLAPEPLVVKYEPLVPQVPWDRRIAMRAQSRPPPMPALVSRSHPLWSKSRPDVVERCYNSLRRERRLIKPRVNRGFDQDTMTAQGNMMSPPTLTNVSLYSSMVSPFSGTPSSYALSTSSYEKRSPYSRTVVSPYYSANLSPCNSMVSPSSPSASRRSVLSHGQFGHHVDTLKDDNGVMDLRTSPRPAHSHCNKYEELRCPPLSHRGFSPYDCSPVDLTGLLDLSSPAKSSKPSSASSATKTRDVEVVDEELVEARMRREVIELDWRSSNKEQRLDATVIHWFSGVDIPDENNVVKGDYSSHEDPWAQWRAAVASIALVFADFRPELKSLTRPLHCQLLPFFMLTKAALDVDQRAEWLMLSAEAANTMEAMALGRTLRAVASLVDEENAAILSCVKASDLPVLAMMALLYEDAADATKRLEQVAAMVDACHRNRFESKSSLSEGKSFLRAVGIVALLAPKLSKALLIEKRNKRDKVTVMVSLPRQLDLGFSKEEAMVVDQRLRLFDSCFTEVCVGEALLREFVMYAYDVPVSKMFVPSVVAIFSERVRRFQRTHHEFALMDVGARRQLVEWGAYMAATLCVVKVLSLSSGEEQMAFTMGSLDSTTFTDSFAHVVTKAKLKRITVENVQPCIDDFDMSTASEFWTRAKRLFDLVAERDTFKLLTMLAMFSGSEENEVRRVYARFLRHKLLTSQNSECMSHMRTAWNDLSYMATVIKVRLDKILAMRGLTQSYY